MVRKAIMQQEMSSQQHIWNGFCMKMRWLRRMMETLYL